MNILFVSDVSIHNPTSGAERVLFEQSSRLQKTGHTVHVITRRPDGQELNREVIHGVTEWRYRADKTNILPFIRSTTHDCKRLFEYVYNEHRCDIINFHQPFSAYGVLRSPDSDRIKKVYTCHSLSFEEFESRSPRPDGVLRRLMYYLHVAGRKHVEKKVLFASHMISVLSTFTRDKLQNVYGIPSEKIVIIPGGVDLERFSPATEKNLIRRRLKLPPDKTILLSVRDLEPRMGLENLIKAMKKVVEDVSNVYLVIGGKGPLLSKLVSLSEQLGITPFVTFAGFIPEEDLPDYYRVADMFVLPTVELEGFGLVTLESLASGVPVLGTPVGGTKEILGKLDSRYLFKDSSPDSLARLIIEMCRRLQSNTDLSQDLSSRCRSFVEMNYSWEQNIVSTEELFSDL